MTVARQKSLTHIEVDRDPGDPKVSSVYGQPVNEKDVG